MSKSASSKRAKKEEPPSASFNSDQEELSNELHSNLEDKIELLTNELEDARFELERVKKDCQELTESDSIGLIDLDKSLRIKNINDAGSRILDLSSHKARGEPLILRIIPDRRRDFLNFFEKVARGEKKTAVFETMLKGKKPSFLLFAADDFEMKEERYRVVVINLSEAIGFEEETRLMRKRVDQAKALERSNADLQQFAYVASHDLKEPLRMISSFLDLLKKKHSQDLDQQAREYVDFAVEGSIRLQRLIDDILDYSRVSTKGKPLEPTDLNIVLSRALDNLRMKIEDSGAVVTHEDLPIANVDAVQIGLVFQNLIDNGIKFNKNRPSIKIGVKRSVSEWIICVKDNGIGISSQYVQRIFGMFQRLNTREEYDGTGMGLAISKHIIERHGGRMWVKSEEGLGSTFFFTLPVDVIPNETGERAEEKGKEQDSWDESY